MAAEDSTAPPTNLPPYPEMIFAAIEALNNKNGSSESAIIKQIESTHGDLPPAHATLVADHLNQMIESGQLTFLKGNYLIPDSDSPAKRGRGRPPKRKSAITPSAYTGPPRPRGRPPKVVDPNAPPLALKVVASSGKGRGRPPKKAKAGGSVAVPVAVQGVVSGVKRGRGRPPKVKDAVAAVVV